MRETREYVGVQQRGEPQLVEEERTRIGRRREVEIEAGRRLVERAAVRSTDDRLEHGGWRRGIRAQQHCEFKGFGGVLERPERRRRKRRLRHDQCRYVPCRSEEQVAPGLGGIVRKECRDAKADQSPGLVHLAGRVPAAHREQAARVEPKAPAPVAAQVSIKLIWMTSKARGVRASQLRASSTSNFTPSNAAIAV